MTDDKTVEVTQATQESEDSGIQHADHYATTVLACASANLQSFTGEFLPSVETVLDWRESVSWLQRTLLPLTRVIDDAAESSTTWRSDLLSEIEWELDQSFLLLRGIGDPVEELESASEGLRRTVGGLKLWKQESGVEFSSRTMGPPASHPMLEATCVRSLVEEYFLRMEKAIGRSEAPTESDLKEQCMASRKLFLAGFFASCVKPDEWQSSQFRRFLDLHSSLLERMTGPSHYRASIRARVKLAKNNRLLNPDLSLTEGAA